MVRVSMWIVWLWYMDAQTAARFDVGRLATV